MSSLPCASAQLWIGTSGSPCTEAASERTIKHARDTLQAALSVALEEEPAIAQKFASDLLADEIDNPPAPFRAAWRHSGVACLGRDPNLGKRLGDICQ
jgi:hypothetical protein